MPREATTVRAYLVAEDYAVGPGGEILTLLPYRVHFTPGYKAGDFYLSSGDARNGGGTFVSAKEALSPQWRDDLETAGALWLIPLLARMASGEAVAEAEVLAAYKNQRGRRARVEEWQVP